MDLRRFPVAAGILLVAVAASVLAQDDKPATAMLVTATEGLRDPNFSGSVVVVTNHGGHGPLGIILNRPTRVPVSRLFPEAERLAALGDKVYFGGPVAGGAISFLYRGEKPETGDVVPVVDGVFWSGSQELLRKLLTRDKPMEGLQIFVGHSRWAPGQLEGEIERGDWKVERASPEAIFSPRPQHPWPARDVPAPEHRG